jgi:two-component system, chemotaxis family, chemotaxis protein CheY
MFSKCSILIVDDDPFARGIIKHHLTRLGIKNIFEASDGEQALKVLRYGRMQLVIADRYMPRLNGLELFCSIQTEKIMKDTPFMMITAEDDKTKIEDAVKLGICHYLVKPFNANMFDDKIHQVLLQPTVESPNG